MFESWQTVLGSLLPVLCPSCGQHSTVHLATAYVLHDSKETLLKKLMHQGQPGQECLEPAAAANVVLHIQVNTCADEAPVLGVRPPPVKTGTAGSHLSCSSLSDSARCIAPSNYRRVDTSKSIKLLQGT
jgi:hypothetical protein